MRRRKSSVGSRSNITNALQSLRRTSITRQRGSALQGSTTAFAPLSAPDYPLCGMGASGTGPAGEGPNSNSPCGMGVLAETPPPQSRRTSSEASDTALLTNSYYGGELQDHALGASSASSSSSISTSALAWLLNPVPSRLPSRRRFLPWSRWVRRAPAAGGPRKVAGARRGSFPCLLRLPPGGGQ
jgi:hypothetical protein